MAYTYTKLFSGIVSSTIWAEPEATRCVWVTLLAMADRNGEVNGTPVGLARIANVSLDNCKIALATLLSPEPSDHDDGRRIEEIEHGWRLLNHGKYRRLASRDESKERNAQRQAAFRARNGKSRGVN